MECQTTTEKKIYIYTYIFIFIEFGMPNNRKKKQTKQKKKYIYKCTFIFIEFGMPNNHKTKKRINIDIYILGGLVGTQRKEAEHVMCESHFEGCTGSTKRPHNAKTKTCGEDHATLS